MQTYILFALAFSIATLGTHWIPAIRLADMKETKVFNISSCLGWLILASTMAPLMATFILAHSDDLSIIESFSLGIKRGK